MAAVNVRLCVHLAWWAKPLSYSVAFASYPFVGEKRALFYAGKAMCLGLRVTAAADNAPSGIGTLRKSD